MASQKTMLRRVRRVNKALREQRTLLGAEAPVPGPAPAAGRDIALDRRLAGIELQMRRLAQGARPDPLLEQLTRVAE